MLVLSRVHSEGQGYGNAITGMGGLLRIGQEKVKCRLDESDSLLLLATALLISCTMVPLGSDLFHLARKQGA